MQAAMFQMLPSIRVGRVNTAPIWLCKRRGSGSSSLRRLVVGPFPACGYYDFNSGETEPRSLLLKCPLSKFSRQPSNENTDRIVLTGCHASCQHICSVFYWLPTEQAAVAHN